MRGTCLPLSAREILSRSRRQSSREFACRRAPIILEVVPETPLFSCISSLSSGRKLGENFFARRDRVCRGSSAVKHRFGLQGGLATRPVMRPPACVSSAVRRVARGVGRRGGKCRAVQSRAHFGPAAARALGRAWRRRGLRHGRSRVAGEVGRLSRGGPHPRVRFTRAPGTSRRIGRALAVPIPGDGAAFAARRPGSPPCRCNPARQARRSCPARQANRPPSPQSFRCGIAGRRRNRRPETPAACTKGSGTGERRRGRSNVSPCHSKTSIDGRQPANSGSSFASGVASTTYQPISFTRLAKTLAPDALASNCAPRQMPSSRQSARRSPGEST